MEFYAAIEQIIASEDFKRRIILIAKNYFNLKQELFIRNYIVEQFNSIYSNQFSVKAIAEYPRDGNSKVDISLIKEGNFDKPFLIELKYNFSNDNRSFSAYENTIRGDFCIDRVKTLSIDTSMFILIVAHWDKSLMDTYSNLIGVKHNLNKYIANEGVLWKNNLNNLFCVFKSEGHRVFEIKHEILEPFKIEYNFFIMTRKGLF